MRRNFPPQELDLAQKRAEAMVAVRKRAGDWTGSTQAHEDYQTRPIEWIVKYLGVREETLRWSMNPNYQNHVWDGDKDPMVQIAEGLAANKDIGVESGTGTGKTFMAACLMYWFLACFEDSIVPTIAPKEAQLLKQIWKEAGDLWPRFERHFPLAEFLPGTGIIRMRAQEAGREKWAAFAFVCGVGASEEVAARAQGLHAEHALFITEETPGIDRAIMRAIEQTRTADHNLQLSLGNPDHQHDTLHLFCVKPTTKHIRISAFDYPNIVSHEPIVPAAIGERRLEERIEELGKGTRLYHSRIRGVSPREPEEALIHWAWCVAASKLWGDPKYREGLPALGVDVADSPSGDEAAIADFQGACCIEVESWRIKKDAEEVAERVYVRARNPERPIDGRHIGVDNVGVGASCYNRLTRLGIRARKMSLAKASSRTKWVPMIDMDRPVVADEEKPDSDEQPSETSESPRFVVESELYDTQRSQQWWRAREDIRMLNVALPPDEELWQDLCTPTYRTHNAQICVEKKEDVVRRLHRSPNKGDAFCYGNFVRHRKPVKRKVKGQVTPSHDRDVMLERRLAHHAKQAAAEEKKIRRMFARRARLRKRIHEEERP